MLNRKNLLYLPISFLTRLSVFFLLCVLIAFFQNWYNVHYYGVVTSVYTGHQFFLVFLFFVLFSVFYRDRIRVVHHYPFRFFWSAVCLLIALIVLFTPFSVFSAFHLDTVLTYFIGLYIIYACLFLGIFGPKFSRLFAKELLLFANGSCLFFLGIYLFDLYWRSFAFILLRPLEWILSIVVKGSVVNVMDLSVSANGFNVIVGAPCAGVYSMFLFSLFYALSIFFLKQKHQIHARRAVMVFVLSLFALYILNILRVALIVFVGATYSKHLAISFFHEYTASLFFLVFLFVYLHFVMFFIVKPTK